MDTWVHESFITARLHFKGNLANHQNDIRPSQYVVTTYNDTM